MKLRDLLARLKATYTGSIGAEFMHISEVEQRQWIYKKLEAAGGNYQLDADTQRRTLERLTAAEGPSATCTPSTSARSAFAGRRRLADPDDGHHHPQRRQGWRQGRGDRHGPPRPPERAGQHLGKNPRKLFDEFEGKFEHDEHASAGDVKYHMGFSADVATEGGPVHWRWRSTRRTGNRRPGRGRFRAFAPSAARTPPASR